MLTHATSPHRAASPTRHSVRGSKPPALTAAAVLSLLKPWNNRRRGAAVDSGRMHLDEAWPGLSPSRSSAPLTEEA
jgi:hypothetical protein